VIARILLSRGARSLAYGALSVGFAEALASRGLSATAMGAVITLALLSGAAFSAAAGALVRKLGAGATLAAAGIVMAVSGVLLLGGGPAIVVACLLGVVSPGAQDVGPFAAIEQVAIATENTAVTRRLSWYNLTGALALALGALLAAVVSFVGIVALYAAAGAIVAAIGWSLRTLCVEIAPAAVPRTIRFGIVERLAALFALDAFAGGFVVQAFVAYWFTLRFGIGPDVVGPLLFGANLLAALSYLLADRVAARIGLLNTMVFTHLPSNVLLCLVPLMPTFPLAAAVLLARYALSQMDVPTREAYTLSLVPPYERPRAAGVTAAVRPAAASVAPVLTGIAFELAALGVPFILAGGIKIAYDLTLLVTFRHSNPDDQPLRSMLR
jgi:hypothetical protein